MGVVVGCTCVYLFAFEVGRLSDTLWRNSFFLPVDRYLRMWFHQRGSCRQYMYLVFRPTLSIVFLYQAIGSYFGIFCYNSLSLVAYFNVFLKLLIA